MADRLIVDGENRPRFYYPHHIHDAKAQAITATSPLASTHSDRLGVQLARLLSDERLRPAFLQLEADIVQLKSAFYDQFVRPAEQGVPTTGDAATAA